MLAYQRLESEVMSGARAVTPGERRQLVSQYDGAIACVDASVARLLSELATRGQLDDTLVVITADHGEAFGERDLVQHGVSVYRNQIQVPLLIKLPRQTQAQVVRERVSLVDVLPTVLAALGIPAPAGVQGVDILTPASGSSRAIFSESFGREEDFNRRLDRVERALFSGSNKLIVSTKGKRELYDVARDPEERRSLFRPSEPSAQQLMALLNAWVAAAPAHGERDGRVDAETLQRLRSLGYVQ